MLLEYFRVIATNELPDDFLSIVLFSLGSLMMGLGALK